MSKRYGGLRAVSKVTFQILPGQICGIAGPNGAGKTTLFNLITGHTRLDEGNIRFKGRDITRVRPHARYQLGLARTFQTPLVFSSATVLENALAGAYFGLGRHLISATFPQDVTDRAVAALRFVGLVEKSQSASGALSVFDKKRLMIASALASKPSLLMLDEPVSGLNQVETDQLVALITSINQSGVTILIIEHVLKVLFQLSQWLMVMHHGSTIFAGRPQQAVRDRGVVDSYLGAAAARMFGSI